MRSRGRKENKNVREILCLKQIRIWIGIMILPVLFSGCGRGNLQPEAGRTFQPVGTAALNETSAAYEATVVNETTAAASADDSGNTVSEKEVELCMAVNVGGTVYYDTGVNSTRLRCGMMDGEITSSCDMEKVPEEDNQGNFGEGFGYQYGIEGTIEVKMENGWRIFATEKLRQQIMDENAEKPQPDLLELNPHVLEWETDKALHADYAAFVSEREHREVDADTVQGEFFYGTDNGYMLVVMCPSASYTEDLKIYNIEDIEIVFPSGMFELLAYKDGIFVDINDAYGKGLISRKAVVSISEYMNLYYNEGDIRCVYRTNYIED